MSDLERAVRRLQDQQEILALKHAFLRAADERDKERMVAAFSEDCRATYAPGQEFVGRDSLLTFYKSNQTPDALPGGETRPVLVSNHQIHNFELIFLSDDEATSRCILHSWKRFEGYPQIPDRSRFARYFDTWTRTDEGWRQSGLHYSVQGEVNGDERACEPEPAWPPSVES